MSMMPSPISKSNPPLKTTVISQAQANKALVIFPRDGVIERIKHLRTTFPGLGLTDGAALVETFGARLRSGKVKMKVPVEVPTPTFYIPAPPSFRLSPDILARYSPAEIKAALTYLEQAVDKIKVRTGAFVKPEGAAAATMIADDLGMFLRDAASRL
jgi:hypothetical protein